jgi:hypothetical protein
MMLFLGGSFHDRDNPYSNKQASHGKPIVWMTLACSQKEGRQQNSSRRELRATGDDVVMMMMMMTIFYGGIGTKCTENQTIATRNR